MIKRGFKWHTRAQAHMLNQRLARELNERNLTTNQPTNTPMALNNETPKIYLSILDGKIVRKVTEGTPGAVHRKNSEDKDVWELRYSNVTGFLTGINRREGKYGKELLLTIQDGDDIYQLNMLLSSGNAKGFLFSVPNIDFNYAIKFKPWMKVVINEDKTESKRVSLYLDQDDVPVPRAFTKDEPNGLPEMKKMMFKGKEVWDDTDQLAFLEQMLLELDIDTKIKDANITRGTMGYQEPSSPIAHTSDFEPESQQPSGPTDDLPF